MTETNKVVKLFKLSIAVLALLLIVGNVSATDSSVISDSSGNIELQILDIKQESGNTIEIAYGDPLIVSLHYPADSDSIQWLDLKDADNNYERLMRRALDDDGIDEVNISSSIYAPVTNFTLYVYAGKVNEVLDTSNAATLSGNARIIRAEVSEPVISLSLHNPSNQIAEGDCVKFEGTITATSYNWTITGPYNSSNFYNVASNATLSGYAFSGTFSDSMRVITYDHSIDVTISTVDILKWAEGTTGTYDFKVWNEAYPKTIASIGFTINDVSVSPLADKGQVHLGNYLTISGTTNTAGTGSIYDDAEAGLNKVFIAVYNNTAAEKCNFVDAFTDNINVDGTFSKTITFELSWDSSTTYSIKVIALSGYDDNNPFTDKSGWAANYEDRADFYDNQSVYVSVEEPQVKFEMDNTTFTKGKSDTSFKGTASLPAGESVYIPKNDIDEFLERGSYTTTTMPDGLGQALRALIGSNGSWESEEVDIRDEAPIGNYTVSAKIFDSSGNELAEDTVNISIVKHNLEANIDKTTIMKGGELTINGSTSVSSVFIFASEKGLFQQSVTENPIASNYYIQASDMEVPVDDDSFSKNLDVRTDADTGNYMLYVYAPSNLTVLNTTEDPKSTFSITIEDPEFVNPPDEVTMVKGQAKDLTLRVPEQSVKDVYVNFTFRSSFMRIDSSEDYDFWLIPDDEGLVEVTIKPFWYNGCYGERLESDYNLTICESDGDSEFSTLLPAGTYSLEAELFYMNGYKIDEATIPVNIVDPEIKVEVPDKVSFDDTLEVKVKTNRESNYYGTYVIIDTGLCPIAQNVKTDDNGTAIASFETYGLGEGTYDIYVRDTMRTIGCYRNINDFYDWNPLIEKSDWASDDELKIKNTTVAEVASKIKLKIGNTTASANTTEVNITALNAKDLANFDINVTYNSSVVNVTSVNINPAFGTAVYNLDHASQGWIRIATLNTGSGLSGNFSVLTLTLETTGESDEEISFNVTVNTLLDSHDREIVSESSSGSDFTGVQGQALEISLNTSEYVDQEVYANFTFEGYGIKITPSEYAYFSFVSPINGSIELTLDPFWYYGPATEKLESDYNLTTTDSEGDSECSILLPVGVYSLEAELFNSDSGAKIEEIEVPVEIIKPTLNVETPEEVQLGEELDVTVNTNRGEGYDGLYVTLETPVTPISQQVTTDQNGNAIASFNTTNLGYSNFNLTPGSYNVYIRDTKRTIGYNQDIDDFYDWDPAMEKSDWASDDVYTVEKVNINGSVESDFTGVQGQALEISLNTSEYVDQEVYANFTFEGYGIKITPSEYAYFGFVSPINDSIELTLEPFWYYGPATEKLESYYNVTGNYHSILLPTGVYELGVELFNESNGIKVEETTIHLQIIEPELDVGVPVEVESGEKLDVTVNTNRGEGYDGLYVTLETPVTPISQQVTTDQNGNAIASFNTTNLGYSNFNLTPGSYNVYIRDTKRTIEPGYTIGDFYDWNPDYEKEEWLKDDILKTKTFVLGKPPTAKFTYSPSKPMINDIVELNASASHDLNGSIISYEWDFGDGNSITTINSTVNHSYSTPAYYQVNLTVTDNDGLTNTTNNFISVGCGDVTCDGNRDISDVIRLLYYVGYPGGYSLCSEWGGDVNGDGSIDISDVIRELYYVGYPGQYTLECKT